MTEEEKRRYLLGIQFENKHNLGFGIGGSVPGDAYMPAHPSQQPMPSFIQSLREGIAPMFESRQENADSVMDSLRGGMDKFQQRFDGSELNDEATQYMDGVRRQQSGAGMTPEEQMQMSPPTLIDSIRQQDSGASITEEEQRRMIMEGSRLAPGQDSYGGNQTNIMRGLQENPMPQDFATEEEYYQYLESLSNSIYGQ